MHGPLRTRQNIVDSYGWANEVYKCCVINVINFVKLCCVFYSGMDPHSRNLVGLTIQQLIQRNRSVILTSHSVEDCEALCSNIAVMINGKIVVQGTPQYLKEK